MAHVSEMEQAAVAGSAAGGAPVRASGIGSWPGTSVREAVLTVRDLLLGADELGVPYLPETPSRGPGADIIGRSAGLLVDLPVDLQPSGWRLVDRPGRDAARTAALRREDLDELAEAYDGYAGPLTVSVCGPWTLLASLQLTRGERAVSDPGARREVTESLAEGAQGLVADVRRLVPGASVVLQVDEPSVVAVLEGALPTASGYGRVREVERVEVLTGLRTVLAAHDGPTVVHCCHERAPVPLLRESGAGALALDLTHASPARWESVAATVESGVGLYAGCVPADGTGTGVGAVESARRLVLEGAARAGLSAERLQGLVVTPTCGLAGLTVEQARETTRVTLRVAEELAAQLG